MYEPDDLIIGCPVYDRAWILPHWFAHTEAAAAHAGFVPKYLFVGDAKDVETHHIIKEQTKLLGRQCYAVWVEEGPLRAHTRPWTKDRYHHMVALRNALLDAVRKLNPALFLSLDSDILLADDSIMSMVDAIEHYDFDAVGGKAYLTPYKNDTRYPTYACFGPEDRLLRGENTTLINVECIMAIKLMKPSAYNIDYAWHHQGEDPGWSRQCLQAGLKLGWDGRVTNRHVMGKDEDLSVPDPRVGF